MSLKGYVGKILYVDLTKQKSYVEDLPTSLAKSYVGGSGLAAYLLWNLVDAGIDPLQPENPLIIATGPATGTLAPSSGRFVLVSKSPLTGVWAESHVGGAFGPQLKYAGYDVIVITGRASRPISLIIDDSHINFYESSGIWGLNVKDTVNELRTTFGRDYHVMC
ncbi:MAG: aldehyde ferredoxin oxidoreductase N-terminal domain-containing protein, partial [Sulfolobales archaeon]